MCIRDRDYIAIPETKLGSNATVDLTLTLEEGPQYRVDKVEFVGKPEITSRLQLQWKLKPGSIYDFTYLDQYLEENHDLLPPGFGRMMVRSLRPNGSSSLLIDGLP